MKVTFLGTAAAEIIPFPYCDCTTCTHARKYKGRNIRKRCSYMINDDLLIDMGPDLFTSCAMYDIDLLKTKYALVSHSHSDHFIVQNLNLRTKGFRDTELPELTFVAGPSVMTMLNQSGVSDEQMELKRKPILPYDRVKLSNDYSIQSLKATHFPQVGDAMNYVIDDGKTKLLIAHDTGVYGDGVWPYLKNIHLDCLIIEATFGTSWGMKYHLNIERMDQMIQKMRKVNALNDQTEIYATHFAHRQSHPHERLSEILQEIGVTCAYDGMVLK